MCDATWLKRGKLIAIETPSTSYISKPTFSTGGLQFISVLNDMVSVFEKEKKVVVLSIIRRESFQKLLIR